MRRASTFGAENPVNMFMTYAGNASIGSVVSWFFLGTPAYTPLGAGRDNTVYVGFATVVFFVWAIAFARNKYWLAVLAAFIGLVWLSFGGVIANLVYYFPGMKFYRHVGLVYPLVKICVALGGGFGLADFLECPADVRMKRTLITIGICLLLLDTSRVFHYNRSIIVPVLMIYFIAFLAWLAIRSVVKIRNRDSDPRARHLFLEHAFALLLISALCLDVVSFRQILYTSWPKMPPQAMAGFKSVDVNELPYIAQRGQDPEGRQKLALLLQKAVKTRFSTQYESLYGFAQGDPCNPIKGIGLLTDGLKVFMDAKFSDNDEKNIIKGCSAPKLRLLDYMQSMDKTSSLDLLKASQEVRTPAVPGKSEQSPEMGNISVVDFTSDKIGIRTQINKKGGAWLVYADSFYPGWHAYVDGVSTQVYEAFAAFKAVFVPEGDHEVRFVFFNNLTSVLSFILAIFGLAAGAGISFLLLITFLGSFDLSEYLSRSLPERTV